LVAVATALGVVLSQSPPTVAGSNSVPKYSPILFPKNRSSGCQPSGTVPQGTSAIRVTASQTIGPAVTLKVLSGSRVVTHGRRDAGWGIDETVTVPVERVPRTVPNALVCLAFGPGFEPVQSNGVLLGAEGANGEPGTAVRFRAEYLKPGRTSWWSRVSPVARRMGWGHSPSGTWIVFLLIALTLTMITLASRLVLRDIAMTRQAGVNVAETLRSVRDVAGRIPRAAQICALIAIINAVCWSLITPPFQVPDEPAHFAYVQQLAETASLPTSSSAEYSEEEEVALQDVRQLEVHFHPENHPLETAAEQSRLLHDLAAPLQRSGSGAAGVAASQPPLYYGLQTIPYLLGSGGTLLDRLELMRLLSALIAGFTALFAYLFVREALPRVPWAWPVGGLAVALSPLLGFMSGTVNPDALLYAAAAAVFYFLARAFRRGLTPGLAIAIGVASAVGTLTKLNFIGLIPGIIVGVVVLALRAPRASRRAVCRSAALAVAIAAVPSLAYVLVNVAGSHAALGSGSQVLHPTGGHGSLLSEISYAWQFYLPRLPGMATKFPGVSTTHIWFERSIGLYGWLDTSFPGWVNNLALILTTLLAALGIRALLVARAALRRRVVELAVYAVMCLGVLALIAAASYASHPQRGYVEPRYLLPLLPLLGAALALSARGAGNRWGPPVGGLIVVLFLAHNLFSQLQVISRYYG
jgi:hypothetical protein